MARKKSARRKPRAQSPEPPALQRLWAPWRSAYVTVQHPKGCFLCVEARERHRVVAKAKRAYALPNLYPYNNGHLLIAPFRHVGTLEALTPQEWADILTLLRRLMKRLRERLHPHGFNVGINLGAAAGAGVPGHLHVHLVPRWKEDTNFMPVIANTKIVSQSLDELMRILR